MVFELLVENYVKLWRGSVHLWHCICVSFNVSFEIALMHAQLLLHRNCMNYRNCEWSFIWWRKSYNESHIFIYKNKLTDSISPTPQCKHVLLFYFLMIYFATLWRFTISPEFCNVSISFLPLLLKIYTFCTYKLHEYGMGGWNDDRYWRSVRFVQALWVYLCICDNVCSTNR